MSNSPTPPSSSVYTSSTPPPGSNLPPKLSTPKPKPASNVFSNDGSFLERFQRSKKEDEEKKQQEDTLARKRDFDTRFKNRGKRPPPDSSSSATSENPPAKKPKSDKPMTEYEKEVKNYAGRSLKDDGIGVRALVK